MDAQLVRGAGGIFDVTAGSQRIWSKREVGRFPKEAEIIDKLRQIR